jgi:hypothetical protein
MKGKSMMFCLLESDSDQSNFKFLTEFYIFLSQLSLYLSSRIQWHLYSIQEKLYYNKLIEIKSKLPWMQKKVISDL